MRLNISLAHSPPPSLPVVGRDMTNPYLINLSRATWLLGLYPARNQGGGFLG